MGDEKTKLSPKIDYQNFGLSNEPRKGSLAAFLLIYILIYEVRKQRKNKRNQPENIVDGQNENLII